MRTQNVYSNRQAPSRDIANTFCVLAHLRYICDGGIYDGSERCGIALKNCFATAPVQHFIHGTSIKELQDNKAIYQPGALRKKQAGSLMNLGDVLVLLKAGPTKLSDLAQTSELHFPAALMNLEVHVQQFKGVVAHNRKLVNIGNSVRIQPIGGGVSVLNMAFWWQQSPFMKCLNGIVLFKSWSHVSVLATNQFVVILIAHYWL